MSSSNEGKAQVSSSSVKLKDITITCIYAYDVVKMTVHPFVVQNAVLQLYNYLDICVFMHRCIIDKLPNICVRVRA